MYDLYGRFIEDERPVRNKFPCGESSSGRDNCYYCNLNECIDWAYFNEED